MENSLPNLNNIRNNDNKNNSNHIHVGNIHQQQMMIPPPQQQNGNAYYINTMHPQMQQQQQFNNPVPQKYHYQQPPPPPPPHQLQQHLQFYQMQPHPHSIPHPQQPDMGNYSFIPADNSLPPQQIAIQQQQQQPINLLAPPLHQQRHDSNMFIPNNQQSSLPHQFGNSPFQKPQQHLPPQLQNIQQPTQIIQQSSFINPNMQPQIPVNNLNGSKKFLNDIGAPSFPSKISNPSTLSHKSNSNKSNYSSDRSVHESNNLHMDTSDTSFKTTQNDSNATSLGQKRTNSISFSKDGNRTNSNILKRSNSTTPPQLKTYTTNAKKKFDIVFSSSSTQTENVNKKKKLNPTNNTTNINSNNNNTTTTEINSNNNSSSSNNNTAPKRNFQKIDLTEKIKVAEPELITISETPPSNSKKPKIRLLSCNNCRIRKIKCDNKFPCGACTKAKLSPDLCSYDTVPWVSSAYQQHKFTIEMKELKDENKALLNQLIFYQNKVKQQETDIKHGRGLINKHSSHSIGPFAELIDPKDDEFIFSMSELQSRYSTLVSYINNKNTAMVPKSKHLEMPPHLIFGPFHFRSLMNDDNFVNKIYKDLFQKSISMLRDNPYKQFIKNYEVKSKNIVGILKNNSLQIVIRKFNVLIDNPYHIKLLMDNFFNGYATFLLNDFCDADIVYTFFTKYFNLDLQSYTKDEGSVSINLVPEMQLVANPEEIIYKLMNSSLFIVISVMLGNTSDLENQELNEILLKYRPLTQVIDLFITASLNYTSYWTTPSYHAIHLFITWARFKQFNQNYIVGFDSDIQYFFDILNTLSFAKNESFSMGLHYDIDELYDGLVDDCIKKRLKQIFRSIMEADISLVVYTGQPIFAEYTEKKNNRLNTSEDVETIFSKNITVNQDDDDDKEFVVFVKFIRNLINDMKNLAHVPCFYYINQIQHFLKEHKELLPTGKLETLKASKMKNRDIFRLIKNFKNGFYLINLMANFYQNIERLMTDLNYPNKEPLKYEQTKNLSLQWTCLVMLLIQEGIDIFDYLISEYKFDPFFKVIMAKEFKHSMIRSILYIGKLVYNSLRSMLSGLFKIQPPTSPETPIDKIKFEQLYSAFNGYDDNAKFLEVLFHKSQYKRLLFFAVGCLENLAVFPTDLEFTDFKHIAELIKNVVWFINKNFKVERCFNELDEDQVEYLSKSVNEKTLEVYGINLNFFK